MLKIDIKTKTDVDSRKWLDKTANKFASVGIETARLDALVLLEHYSKLDRAKLLAGKTIKQTVTLAGAVKRRLNREPLAYILGHKEFFGYEFKVNSNVLIPRPESEAIVEYVTGNAPDKSSLLDVGTGSGCLAIAIKLKRPDVQVTASDIDSSSLDVARLNASRLKADVEFLNSDLFESIYGKYDILVANLPYVPLNSTSQAELTFEPKTALYAEDGGLALYKRFSKQFNKHLDSGGSLVLEHNPDQLDVIKSIFSDVKQVVSISNFVTVFKY